MKTILSTKKLKINQRELLLNAKVSFVEYDAIQIQPIEFSLPQKVENIIFTSKNAVNQFLSKIEKTTLLPSGSGVGSEGPRVRVLCVGQKTKVLLEQNNYRVEHSAENASALANYIINNHKESSFHFFCGNLRKEDLPKKLKKNGTPFEEIEVYKTEIVPKAFNRKFDAVLFFSPSGVRSFAEANDFSDSLAVCIGNTTASEAKKFTENTAIANSTSVESVIAKAVKLVNKKP